MCLVCCSVCVRVCVDTRQCRIGEGWPLDSLLNLLPGFVRPWFERGLCELACWCVDGAIKWVYVCVC